MSNCYGDLWKTASERKNDQYQGIDTSGNRNTMRIRIDAGNKDEAVAADKAIADAFGNRFYIPLDFELLESHMPFYHSALGDRLEHELTINDYSRVIRATGDADASYDIENISLEYEIVTQPELARIIANQYGGRLRSCMTGYCGTVKSAETRATPSGTLILTCPPAA